MMDTNEFAKGLIALIVLVALIALAVAGVVKG